MDELLLIGNCSPCATYTSSAAKDVKHELEATTYSEKEDILSKPDTNKKKHYLQHLHAYPASYKLFDVRTESICNYTLPRLLNSLL